MRPFLLKQAYFIKIFIFTKIIINDMRPSLIRTFQAVVSAVLMVSFLVACGPQEPEVKNVPVSGVSVSPASLSLVVGDTANLTAKVSPSDATSQTVTWSSSNQSVASVSNGTVTALQEGKTTITATAGGKSATCEVTVSAKVIPVTGISFEQASVSIPMGETANLIATVSPSDATDATVTWSSSDPSVATVDKGNVSAIKEGTATITATVGDKSATCEVTVTPDKETLTKLALMKIYDAMDGDNWFFSSYYGGEKWDLNIPLNHWCYVEWSKSTGELELWFGNVKDGESVGLKGKFPDCFDELQSLTELRISNEPGITGTLPPSFNKLKNLKVLSLFYTSMTSLPDVFNGIPLERADIIGNKKMTGSLPQSLGSSPSLNLLDVESNIFTGTVPDSWALLGEKLQMRREPFLDRRVPDSFVTAPKSGYLINMYMGLAHHHEMTPSAIEVGDYEIPAFWPEKGLTDLVSGEQIPYNDIYSKNKYTILLNWGTWCSFSKVLVPNLKRMYEKYHKDGLEIIAAMNTTGEEHQHAVAKAAILERGYDLWYNFDLYDLGSIGDEIWPVGGTPSAIIVDNKGNIVRSSDNNISDPSRNRFGYGASGTLIPWLEEVFGPMEGDSEYASSDYSQDGKYFTIQKATVGKGINLVFMGDAYTDKDISSGLYEKLMKECAKEFFNIEPFKSFKNRFNVYAVNVVSKNGKTGEGYETALKATMGNGSGTGDNEKVLQYALKVPGISSKDNLVVGVMVNSSAQGGITKMLESEQSGIGYFSSNSNYSDLFGSTLRHEVGGHAFGFLGDEYATNFSASPTQEMIDEYNRLYKAYGWYSNIDFTNDPKKVKWADFLSDDRYKDEVGIYEGGINLGKGVYRPSQNSMMNQNEEYFNAPSRWAIYKRIMELSGETPSFSRFLEYDAINRGSSH